MTTTTKGPDLRDYLFAKVGFTPTNEQRVILDSPYRVNLLSHRSIFLEDLLRQISEDSIGLSQRTMKERELNLSTYLLTSARLASSRRRRNVLILVTLHLLMERGSKLKAQKTQEPLL